MYDGNFELMSGREMLADMEAILSGQEIRSMSEPEKFILFQCIESLCILYMDILCSNDIIYKIPAMLFEHEIP